VFETLKWFTSGIIFSFFFYRKKKEEKKTHHESQLQIFFFHTSVHTFLPKNLQFALFMTSAARAPIVVNARQFLNLKALFDGITPCKITLLHNCSKKHKFKVMSCNQAVAV
jgi:hypothetical protein